MPKFQVGDIVEHNNGRTVTPYEITAVGRDNYLLANNNGIEVGEGIGGVDANWRKVQPKWGVGQYQRGPLDDEHGIYVSAVDDDGWALVYDLPSSGEWITSRAMPAIRRYGLPPAACVNWRRV